MVIRPRTQDRDPTRMRGSSQLQKRTRKNGDFCSVERREEAI